MNYNYFCGCEDLKRFSAGFYKSEYVYFLYNEYEDISKLKTFCKKAKMRKIILMKILWKISFLF